LTQQSDRSDRLVERCRELEKQMQEQQLQHKKTKEQCIYFASTVLKLQRTLEGKSVQDEELEALTHSVMENLNK
jgi:hypothetical protein